MLSFDIPTINNTSTSNNILATTTIKLGFNREEKDRESYGRSTVNLLMNIYDHRPAPRFPSSDIDFILEQMLLCPNDKILELYFCPTYNWRRSNCMIFRLRDDKSVEDAKCIKDLIEQLALSGRIKYCDAYTNRPEVHLELTIEPEGATIPVSRSERLPNIRIGIIDTGDKSNVWHLFGMNAGIEVDR